VHQGTADLLYTDVVTPFGTLHYYIHMIAECFHLLLTDVVTPFRTAELSSIWAHLCDISVR